MILSLAYFTNNNALNITADGDCSHEIKRHLLLGRKAITNLDRILKIRDITLPTKVHLVKVMVFPLVMYGCDYWIIKKAEHQRIDAFELLCQRRLLRVPWTARRSEQSILKEISTEYSLGGLMLKLKLQYFGHLLWRTDSLDKLIKFSVNGQGCVPSPLFDLQPNYGGDHEDNGDLFQNVSFRHCCTQCPQPCSRPLPTHASLGDLWTLMGKCGSVSPGVTAPFSRVLVHKGFHLCPPRVCFPSPV